MPLVLIVEDFEDARELYAEYLKHRGLDVVCAAAGPEGIALARERQPDAIVMDAGLPGMSGWEATSVLKGDPITAPICILMLTGHVFQEAEAHARRVGVNVFLRKPCLPDDLYAEIVHALEVDRCEESAAARDGGAKGPFRVEQLGRFAEGDEPRRLGGAAEKKTTRKGRNKNSRR